LKFQASASTKTEKHPSCEVPLHYLGLSRLVERDLEPWFLYNSCVLGGVPNLGTLPVSTKSNVLQAHMTISACREMAFLQIIGQRHQKTSDKPIPIGRLWWLTLAVKTSKKPPELRLLPIIIGMLTVTTKTVTLTSINGNFAIG
jgi:hypothetical protein